MAPLTRGSTVCTLEPNQPGPRELIIRSFGVSQQEHMAGVLIPFLPMTEFNFSFLTSGATKTIVLRSALDVSGYYYARLLVRVHEIDFATGGSPSIQIGGFGTDPSPEDPRDFALTTSTLSVSVDGSQAAGALQTDTDTDIYPFLKMYVKGTQGTSSGAKLYAVLSADLLLREA